MKTFQTTDKTLETNPDYIQIRDALYLLVDSGFDKQYTGYCVDASRVIVAVLAQNNIESTIQQCCALLTHNKDKLKQLYAIGFHAVTHSGEIDTHFVAITKTDPPFLVDMSIGRYLLNEQKIILERAQPNELVLGNYTYDNFKLTYIQK